MEYIQKDLNNCLFSSLDYALFVSGEIIAVENISRCIKESLVCQHNGYYYRVIFSNLIMLDQAQNKGYNCLHYKIKQWKIKGDFEILNNISENVTLVQLIDTVGNV